MRIAAAKYPADVAADVTSGPSDWRRRRRYGNWRGFPRQISRRGLSCSQTNRGSKKHQRVFPHCGPPIGHRQATARFASDLYAPNYGESYTFARTPQLLGDGVLKVTL